MRRLRVAGPPVVIDKVSYGRGVEFDHDPGHSVVARLLVSGHLELASRPTPDRVEDLLFAEDPMPENLADVEPD